MTTSSEKISEPSMDDILASIRKIIAEEPTRAPVISRHAVPPKAVASSTKPGTSSGPTAAANPPTAHVSAAPAPSATRPPSSLAARINGQVAAPQPGPTALPGPSTGPRSSLTGSIASAAAKAGKDKIAIDDLLDDLADSDPDPAPAARVAPVMPDVELKAPRAEPEPTRSPPAPVAPPAAVPSPAPAAAAEPATDTIATPVRSLFSPLGGPADAPGGRSDGEGARRQVPPLFDNAPPRLDGPAPAVDLGAVVPGRDASSAVVAATPVAAPPVDKAVPHDDADARPEIVLAVTPRSIVAPGLPRLSEPTVPTPSDDPSTRAGSAAMAATAALAPGPAAARVFGPAAGPKADALPTFPAASPAVSSPLGGAPGLGTVLPGTAPVRTLEDTVSDLLRPMIRQWLDQNMPRMVERALKIEVADVATSDRDKGPPAR